MRRVLFTPALAALAIALYAGDASAAFPGGNGRLVYVDSGLARLMTSNADGTGATPLLDTGHAIGYPQWSKDARKIVFDQSAQALPFGGARDVWIVNSDGTCPTQLTNGPEDEWAPTISPDGTKIAYQRITVSSTATTTDVWVMNADGSGQHALTASGDAWHPAWSPDGSQIAIEIGEQRIAVVNADGTGFHYVTDLADVTAAELPNWSPDGSKLVFDGRPAGTGADQPQIFSVSAVGTGLTQLTHYPTVDPLDPDSVHGVANPAYSPDGTKIVYDTITASFATTGRHVMNANGTGDTFIGSGTNADWEPTGNPSDGTPALACPPAHVSVTPLDATNAVGTSHTVTATVTDTNAHPSVGATVLFQVRGADTVDSSCTTDSAGQCSFSYTGPDLPGADQITAWADRDGNTSLDAGEPSATATKAWVVPAATAGQVTGGGQVRNSAGTDNIAFGFTAKSDANGLKGECTLVDPSANSKIKCTDVTDLVQSGTHATLFGHATVNGTPTTYRIDVDDNGEPGAGTDTFKVHTASGYTAGATGPILNGNVQVRTG